MVKKEKILNLYFLSVDFLFCLLCVLVALKPEFFHFRIRGFSVSFTSARNLTIFFVVYALPYVFYKRREIITKKNILVLFFCYLWVIVSIIVNNGINFFESSSFFVVSIYFLFYLYVFLKFRVNNSDKIYDLLLRTFVIVNIANLFFHFYKGIEKIVEEYPFWSGKNMFSVVSIASFFTAMDFFIKKRNNYIAVTLLCFSFINIITVYSRAGIIAFVFALFTGSFLYINKKSVMNIFVILILLMVVGIAVFLPVKNRNRLKSAISFKDYNTRERIEIWKGAIKIIKENPIFGIGAGKFSDKFFEMENSFGFERAEEKKGNYHAHNLFLQVASESGIIPAVVLGLYYLRILFVSYFLCGKKVQKYGVTLFLISYFIYSFFDSSYNAKFSHSSMFHLNLIILIFIAFIDASIDKLKRP